MGEYIDEQKIINWIAEMKSDDPELVAKAQSEYSTLKHSQEMGDLIIDAKPRILKQIVALLVNYPFSETQATLLYRCCQPNLDISIRNSIIEFLKRGRYGNQWQATVILHLLGNIQELRYSGIYRLHVGKLVHDFVAGSDSKKSVHFLLYILKNQLAPSETGEAVVKSLASLTDQHEIVVSFLLDELQRNYNLHVAWASGTGFTHPRAYCRGLIQIGSDAAIQGLIVALHEASKIGNIDHIIAEEMERSSVPQLLEAVETYRRSMRKD